MLEKSFYQHKGLVKVDPGAVGKDRGTIPRVQKSLIHKHTTGQQNC